MIHMNDITKIYNNNKPNKSIALNHIDLDITSGEFIAITGKSGAGKSTLLHIIGCIDNVTSGLYKLFDTNVANYNDKDLSKIRNQYFGFVMQDYALINNISVFDNIMLPALLSKSSFKNIVNKTESLSEKLQISHLLNKNINQLSGGEQQRVAIARALINTPRILIADEPTGNLDSYNSQIIYDLFRMINNEGVTVIVVTHDLDLAQKFERLITLRDGKIV